MTHAGFDMWDLRHRHTSDNTSTVRPWEGLHMGLLFLLSGWLFGGDVHRLGGEWYPARQAATERLKVAGWLAYPALLVGSQSANAETADRCGDLLDRLDGAFWLAVELEGVARGVLPLPEAASDEYLSAVCRRVDRLGGWNTSDGWAWVRASPYRMGSKVGDCRYMVGVAAAKREIGNYFPPLVPQQMPSSK